MTDENVEGRFELGIESSGTGRGCFFGNLHQYCVCLRIVDGFELEAVRLYQGMENNEREQWGYHSGDSTSPEYFLGIVSCMMYFG